MTALRDAIDYTTLGWVKPEVDETLRQARIEIEGFADDPADTTRMRFCASYLHQVQGTLRMVELYAPAMVVEEMEQLAHALQVGETADRDAACATLMRGVVLLPDYLERLQSGHKDIPIVLLPLLNELRAARGQGGLSESVLFAPDLARPLPATLPPVVAAVDSTVARALEMLPLVERLSAAVAAWPEQGAPADSAELRAAIDALVERAVQEDTRRMLWVASSVAAAIDDRALVPTPSLRQAFGSVQREARRQFEDDGFASPNPETTLEPTRQLLYHVAHSDAAHPALDELRSTFDLAAQLPSASELSHAQSSLTGRNRALLETVASAVKEDLLRVKDALDLHLRAGTDDVAGLQPQVESLGRVADTLGMLGLGVARGVVQQQRDAMQAIVSGARAPDEGALLDVAGALLYVDATLDDQVARLGDSDSDGEGAGQDDLFSSESRKLMEVIAREAIANFADARQAFVAFVETSWDHAELAEVPRLLREVSGAMTMLELGVPAAYLEGVRMYAEVELIGRRRVPNGRQLDTFADALASLEYYLEALREHRGNRDDILDIARNSLETLGYWPLPVRHDGDAATDAVRERDAADPSSDEIERTVATFIDRGGLPPVAGATGESPARVEMAPSTPESPAVPVASAPVPAADPILVVAQGEGAGGFEAVGDEIDDEIRDVFIEEFGEEIDNLDQMLPLWRSEPDNMERVRPIRRVFHTLKGSGRLVGARVLGEFSWKVENMLNRVLDGTRAPTPAVVAMVDNAFYTLPQLLAALRGDGTVTADLDALQSLADRVADGEEAFASAPVSQPSAASAVPATTDAAEIPAAIGAAPGAPVVEAVPASVDALLLEILETEVTGHLVTVDDWLQAAASAPTRASDALLRSTHTMNGAFAMTEVPAITDALGPAEGYIRRLLASGEPAGAAGVAALAELAAVVRTTMLALQASAPMVPTCTALAATFVALRDALPEGQPASLAMPDALDDHDDERGAADVTAPGDFADADMAHAPERGVELTSLDLSAYGNLAHSVGPAGAAVDVPETAGLALETVDDAATAPPSAGETDHHAAQTQAAAEAAARVEAEAHAAAEAAALSEAAAAEAAAQAEAESIAAAEAAALADAVAAEAAARAEAEALAMAEAQAEADAAARIEAEARLAEEAQAIAAAAAAAEQAAAAAAAQAEAEAIAAAEAAAAAAAAAEAEAAAAEAAVRAEADARAAADAHAAAVAAAGAEADAARSALLADEQARVAAFEAAVDLSLDGSLALAPSDDATSAALPSSQDEPDAATATVDAATSASDADDATAGQPSIDAGATEPDPADAARLEAERVAAEDELEYARLEQHYAELDRLAREQADAAAEADAARVDAAVLDAERVAAEARFAVADDVAAGAATGDAAAEPLDDAHAAAAPTAEDESAAQPDADAHAAEPDRVTDAAGVDHSDVERIEAERIEAERLQGERAEAERIEAERIEAERIEAERIEAERAEAERIEAERIEAEGAEAERIEAERIEAEGAEAERIEAERIEAERIQAERIQAERIEAERVEAERTAQDERDAEQTAAAPATIGAADAAHPSVESAVSALLADAMAGTGDPDAPLDLSGLDPELVDIFVEEAGDLLDHSDGLLAQLRAAPGEREPLVGLQRDLHTIKGGARMAGIMAIGELGHAMETLLEAVVDLRSELGNDGVPLLERGFDRLHAMVTRVGGRLAIDPSDALIAEFNDRASGRFTTARDSVDVGEGRAGEIRLPSPKVELAPLSSPIGDALPGDEDDIGVRAPQEQVRIRADLLDRLVTYAGEVAIYRSRLEQQLGAFRGAMGEMEQTNMRLRDQLRRLDIETEAQIIARFQREPDTTDGAFDPLELDRFSTLQQLSRALGESAADLSSLQGTLDDLTRQYETLLLQQSRVSSDLQEGLMRTRMVPFDALVPRLRRVVRQAASDTGKQVQLKLDGAQGELDRNVLERMTAPLEHMLRNAVAHGLEDAAGRRSAKKSDEGTVRIAVRREGSEVVLEVGDDGGGLDRDAIRRRAEERGLLRADAVLADSDLDAMILQPGFSTASEVSRLAGRGVGMDVVASEVRQLGGTLDIGSRRGAGTTFTLRLPQTLAVTQAVFVKIGETSFAVPIASVRGVGRLARELVDVPGATYAYGGEDYVVHDLGGLVGQAAAKAEGQLQMPVLLIRAGDLRAAVVVDQITGNREIVVKPVGPQVASIPGIFGATVMGDGRVVVILDVAPLVRRQAALPRDVEPVAPAELRHVPLVMVVDDSVTMRKVTGRVLERNNFEVASARDGIDALERMADRVPDLMLLDIEMPRMDGYELATIMKADPRLRDVPIVMITSRTGEKHRQRAFEIGVERYLGKPYQENELIRNVYELLKLQQRGDG